MTNLIVVSRIKLVVFNAAILAFASRILVQAPLPLEIEGPARKLADRYCPPSP